MRYALLSDIHGNLPALDAALEVLARAGIDRYLCAGDLVGYGPFPNECVERIAELDAVCVAGNHDLIALGELSDEQCIPLARNSLRWTREVLRSDSRNYLAALPIRTRAEDVCIAHGSLEDPQEYVTRPEQFAAQLERLPELEPDAELLVLGHTHRSGLFPTVESSASRSRSVPLSAGRLYALNPGSVGQSRERDALASFAVLDTELRELSQFRVPYDVARCRAELRCHGLPPESYHLFPSLARRCMGRAKRIANQVLALTGASR